MAPSVLSPLRQRDFRALWSGMCVSLLGDGVFLVALAWQVYALSDVPGALSLVGIAMTTPTVTLLLLGGVVSDRMERRRVMLLADLVRGLAVGALALLALTGRLELWHVCALVAVYGAGGAFFGPAFDAIVPDVLPAEELPRANALDQLMRPLAQRLAGPALGGILIQFTGSGGAFALDAATFGVSAIALMAMRPAARRPGAHGSVRADVGTALRFVRRRPWLWLTLATAGLAQLLFLGPVEVLLPFLVKHQLHGSALDLGIVLAAGGLGSVACALWLGRRGLPRRAVAFMYAAWGVGTLAVAGYGLAGSIGQLMIVALVFNALETAGTIVWATAKQRRVPAELLGRVASLDWLVSTGLMPLSLALTGPIGGALGARTTLVGAGLLGALVTLAPLLRLRSLERPGYAGAAG